MEALHSPVSIAPNLAAGVDVDGTWVTCAYSDSPGDAGRTRYRWAILWPDGSEDSGDDLQSGCQGGDLTEGLKSLLCFLSACGESRAYAARTGSPGENADLFPERVALWAESNRDELSILECEIEEN